MRFESLAIHSGFKGDEFGSVSQGITLSTTFERLSDGTFPKGFNYARDANPNRTQLEEALTALEGGAEALVYSSGMAAANAVFECLSPGDHVLLPFDAYYALRVLATTHWQRWGLDVETIDFSNVDTVAEHIKPTTKLIWIETPTNPMLRIADIAAICALARARDIFTVADNTWATPYLQRPLDLGADVSMHSATKYLGGHCDVTLGALICRKDFPLTESLRTLQVKQGAVPSPFDSWMIHRGLATLAVRMERQCDTAELLADFLNNRSRVAKVHYPGLPCHSGIGVASKQMSRWGAMLSFQVEGGAAQALEVANKCNLITQATSLGGPHSLIEHRKSIEGPDSPTPENLLRLSVGLEHVDDLIADLTEALA